MTQRCSPQGSCLASRQHQGILLLVLVSAVHQQLSTVGLPRSRTKCLGSASLFLARRRLSLEVFASILLEAHELVAFHGFVVH